MGNKILVTGGTGYIGSHTVVELMESGYEVVIVDNLSNSDRNVLEGIKAITGKCPYFEEVDCLDRKALDRVFTSYSDIQGVIHFAASKAVGESVQKPLLYYRNYVSYQRNRNDAGAWCESSCFFVILHSIWSAGR